MWYYVLVLLVLSAFSHNNDDEPLWCDLQGDGLERSMSEITSDDQEGVDPSIWVDYLADFNAYLELDEMEDDDLEDLHQIHSIFSAHRKSHKIKVQRGHCISTHRCTPSVDPCEIVCR